MNIRSKDYYIKVIDGSIVMDFVRHPAIKIDTKIIKL